MSVQPSAHPAGKRPAMTMHSLMKMLAEGDKISMLTAYDATFAALADLAGIEIILVGDSLGMVCQGHNSTLPCATTPNAWPGVCKSKTAGRLCWATCLLAATPHPSKRSKAPLC